MYSKVTTKGQATIPLLIRQNLGLKPGSWLCFLIQGDHLLARKVEPFDREYHAALSHTLSEEWDSKEDDDAFANL